MVVVPSGSFMMGAASDEKSAGTDEFPQHRVRIPQALCSRQIRDHVCRMGRMRGGGRLQRLPS